MHPAGNAIVAGRGRASGAGLYRALQRRALEQGPPETTVSATSPRTTCSLGVSLRSRPRGTGSWRRSGTNGRFVASLPCEKLWLSRRGVLPGRDSGYSTCSARNPICNQP
jgi:hypothetical protein